MPTGIYKRIIKRGGYKLSEETKKRMRNSSSKYWLGKHHSEVTKEKIRQAKLGRTNIFAGKKRPEVSGEKSNFWKGGITPENNKIRYSLEYRLWRKACMERDNFTDAKTGVRGGNLEVHHINNFSDFPELRLAIDNGITLSKESHKEFHKKYGEKNNSREQLIEFLTKK